MKHHFSDQSQLVHWFANADLDFLKHNHERFSSSSIFSEGDTIFSYGYHFPVLKRLTDKVCLFNPSQRSVTTSGHQSAILLAHRQYKIFHTPSIPIHHDIQSYNHEKNLNYYEAKIRERIRKSLRARKPEFKEFYLKEAEGIFNERYEYVKFFKLQNKAAQYVVPSNFKKAFAKESKTIQETLNQEREQLKIAKAKEREQFETVRTAYHNRDEKLEGFKPYFKNFNAPDLLRLYKNSNSETFIETSQRVLIEVTSEILAMLKLYLANRFDSLKGKHVQSFTIGSVTEKLVTIGCHRIEKCELEYIAKELGVQSN